MDSTLLGDYAAFAVLLAAGFAFVGAAMTANRLLRPSAPSRTKGEPYECGVETEPGQEAPKAPGSGAQAGSGATRTGVAPPPRSLVGADWAQVQIRYYVYAFLFVLFAVEAVFLFPWAAVFAGFGVAAAVEMGLFVTVLALGLAYAWRRGVLKWQ
ncbi:NADH-quinone oxidoreductase subunit A [Glycomyces buryatensis]|uniref:NADH-quinone oxidoreductase subunit n=1 Tax=Glycomyces buryatensis TaxID=2570927 RepID=A0A4S8QK64_9ACTN|nr:NADH-quinone oxidoreductase subunit A [Glycomyces buryatensis]THV41134.1 NADH-quinone oxidoreductase subunit A [Glycomyces buryatensis]